MSAESRRQRRRPSRRALTTIGVAGLLFLVGTTAQAGWLFVLASGVMGLVAGSLFVRHRLNKAQVEWHLPARTRVGDEVGVGLTVGNSGRRALPLMRLEDRHPAFEPVAVLVERVTPGQTLRFESVRLASRRGRFKSATMELRTGSPLGFFRTVRRFEIPAETTVVPRWVDLSSFPILEPSSFPSDVLHERARTGAGEEYLGVRDYRPGDAPRSVHWRSTARAGHLVVREYQEEVATRVAIVLAGKDTGDPPDSAYEALVSAAASIGTYSLMTGHPIHGAYATPGGVQEILDPDRFALLDWLAGAQPSDTSLTGPVKAALARVGRRGTIVLLAPTIGRAGASFFEAVRRIQSAGSRAIVIAARSPSWAGRQAVTEEQAALQALQGERGRACSIGRGDDLLRCLQA